MADVHTMYRPAYKVKPTDMEIVPGTCPYCRGPRPTLIPRLPPGAEGDLHQPGPNFELVAGLKKFIRPYVDTLPCSACELRSIVARVLPSPRPAIVGPIEAFMQRVAVEAADNPRPPPDPAIVGLVPAGVVKVTRGAALASLRRSAVDVEAPDHQWERGIPMARELVGEHVRGNFGSLGRIEHADVELGRAWHLAGDGIDRNAASIEAGVGPVASVWHGIAHPPTDPATKARQSLVLSSNQPIRIRTELGAGLTLVCLANEL